MPRVKISIVIAAGFGKQEFCRTDFDSRLLAAEGEGGGGRGQVWVRVRSVSEVKQYPSGSG
jgi:hypothetical protein